MRTEQNFRRVARVCAVFRSLFAKSEVAYVGDPPTPGPVIYIANHRSFFDIPVGLEFFLRHGISPEVAVHGRFFSNRVLGAVLRYVGAQPLGKGLGEEWLASATSVLAGDRAVALMPQGRITTSADHQVGVGSLKSGVVRLAQATGAPVVPIGASGTNHVWPRGRPFPHIRFRRPTVRLSVGAAMFAVDRDPAEFLVELTDTIAELVTD